MPENKTDSFERAFADYAYMYIKENAPRLLDYVVGFQVVERNEKGTKAAGVFGINIDNQWFFAPVIFDNGDLKGKQLLYVPSEDVFIPLIDKWVTYILSRKPLRLGKKELLNDAQLALYGPDFTRFKMSPMRGWSKGASVAFNGVEVWKQMVKCSRIKLNRYTFDDLISIPAVIKKYGHFARSLIMHKIKTDEKFADALVNHYSMTDIKDLIKDAYSSTLTKIIPFTKREFADNGLSFNTFKEELVKIADSKKWSSASPQVTTFLKKHGIANPNDVRIHYATLIKHAESVLKEVQAVKPEPDKDVYVITRTEVMDKSYVPEHIRNALNNTDIIVQDNRDIKTLSQLYETRELKAFSAVKGHGYYYAINRDGATEPVLVLQPYCKRPHYAVIYRDRDGLSVELNDKLAVKAVDETDESVIAFKEFVKSKVAPIKTITKGNKYIVADHDLTTYKLYIYKIIDRINPDVGVIGHITNWGYAMTDTYDFDKQPTKTLVFSEMSNIFTEQERRCDDYDNNFVAASDDVAIEIKSIDKHSWITIGRFLTYDEYSDIIDLKGTPLLKFKKSGNTWIINGETYFSKKAACEALLLKYNLDASSCYKALAAVEKAGKYTGHIKRAAPYVESVAGAPTGLVGTADTFSGAGYNSVIGVNEQYPVEINTILTNLEKGEPEMYDPFNTREDRRMNEIYQPEGTKKPDTDSKEVFDLGVLKTLLKTIDITDNIDKFGSDLVVGMDRAGRLLFLFYWRRQAFEERYGSDELKELEDNLVNIFTTLGDLVLFLRQREGGSALLSGYDVSLSPAE